MHMKTYTRTNMKRYKFVLKKHHNCDDFFTHMHTYIYKHLNT